MIGALLVAALALPPAQGRPLPASVRSALEELGLESIDDAGTVLGREPDAPTARALAAIAFHLSNTGGLEPSVPLFEDVLRTRKQLFGPADASTLFAVGQLSRVLLLLGRHGEAIEIVEEHLFEVEDAEGIDPRYFQMVLSNHALNLKEWGDSEAAVECMRRSLDLIVDFAGRESPQYARDVLNLALILGDLGRWTEAVELARQGLALRLEQSGEGSRDVARALRVLGMVQRESGALLEAESALRRAEASLRTQWPVDVRELGEVLVNLGALEADKGAGRAAVDAFREARGLLVGPLGAGHARVLEADVGLASGHLMLHEFVEAHTHIERAVEGLTQLLGPTHWSTCQARARLAAVVEGEGRLDEAVAILRSVASEVERPPPGFGALLDVQLASCLTDAGDLDAAHEALERSLRELEQVFGSDSRLLVEPLLQGARVHELRGDLVAAESAAARALELSMADGRQLLGGDLARSLHSVQFRQMDAARIVARMRLTRGAPQEALEALEIARAWGPAPASAATPEHEARLLREEDARARLRALETRQAARQGRGESLGEADADELARARNALVAATAELTRSMLSRRPAPVPAARARAALRDGEVLLAFVWAPEQVAWIALWAGAVDDAVRHGVCASGVDDVAQFERALTAYAAALTADPRSRGAALPALPPALVELPAAAGLERARRVLWLPDGPLGTLPLELLFDGTPRPDVATVTSLARVVARSGDRSVAPEGGRALVVGDPAFGEHGIAAARGASDLGRLPAANAEARYVAGLWGQAGGEAELVLGEDATRERLEAECAGVRLLHLATHGFPGSERAPYDAALALAAAPAEGTGDWVDALTLDRLLRRWQGRLDGCDLVVLSACETNREVVIGTGLYSLAGGFQRAGANSVLASLWRVDETATALLMGRFTENLTGLRPDLHEGGAVLPTAEALREARAWLATASRDEVRTAIGRMQLDAASEGARGAESSPRALPDPALLRPYADPFYWAGFVLIE